MSDFRPLPRTLSSTPAYRGRKVRVRRDLVALADGSLREVDVVEHPGCAVVVPVDEAGQVLLLRQYRHAIGEWAIEVPAGGIDPGETPAACAARELEEETGLRAGRLEPLGQFYTSDGVSNELAHLFLARDLRAGIGRAEEGEHLEPFWVPLEEAVRLVRAGTIRCGPTALALLLADARLRHEAPGARSG
ncbi:MAG: NUDIX hydrolase [Chloroflexota bacterium]|nr:NUDIX hydrolase [Dehalococcoidia bacterium]MDW8253609.1 NUDIX hydrolase [Chloroflexota bacterium]